MASSPASADSAGSLRAGVARIDITTDDRKAVIHDRLHAKALVLDDGTTRIAIIAMDVTAIGGRAISCNILPDVGEEFLPRLRERIQNELGIPGRHVLVNASHTHPPGRMLCDDDEQVRRVFDAVRRAAGELEPVTVGSGVGHEDRLTINRNLKLKNGRHWTIRHTNPCPPSDEVVGVGPMDPRIGVLRIDRADGRPLAVIFNFASHLLFANPKGAITADYPAVASRLLEQALGHGSTAMFLQGATGDIVDIYFKEFTRPRNTDPLGLMLGQSTLEAHAAIATGPARLNVLSEIIQLPRRTDFPQRLAAMEQRQEELLESLRCTTLNFESFLPLYLRHRLNPDNPGDYSYQYLQARQIGSEAMLDMDAFNRRLIEKYLKNLRAMEELAKIREDMDTLRKHRRLNDQAGSTTIPAEIQGIRIGDCALIAAPLEVLTQVSLNIKQASPFAKTFIAAFSNGYMHYGSPVSDYDKDGYEVNECLLDPGWQAIFESKVADILRRL